MKSFYFVALLAAVAFAVDCNITMKWPNGEKYAFNLCPLDRLPNDPWTYGSFRDTRYSFNFFNTVNSKCPEGTNVCEYRKDDNIYIPYGFLNTTTLSIPAVQGVKPGDGMSLSYIGEPMPSGVRRYSYFTLLCDPNVKPENIEFKSGYGTEDLVLYIFMTSSGCGKKVDY